MPKEWTPEEREAASLATKARHEAKRQQRESAQAVAADPEPEPEPIPMAPIVHEGEARPPEFEGPTLPGEMDDDEFHEHLLDDVGDDDFVRFLMAQDDETRRLLTDIELRVIFETETKRAAEEKKAAARKGALARAQRHARIVAGLIPAEAAEASARLERLSRKVSWTVNMPEAGNSGMLTDVGVRIDGRLLQHGQTITGTLAQYESYREIEWRAHQGELDFQGKGKMSRLRQSAIRSLNYEGPRL